MARCHITGDPHVKTFDKLYYHIYTTGNFIYVRNLFYVPIEVSPRSRSKNAKYVAFSAGV